MASTNNTIIILSSRLWNNDTNVEYPFSYKIMYLPELNFGIAVRSILIFHVLIVN